VYTVYSLMILTELTDLIIRSTNHGGLPQNTSILPADTVRATAVGQARSGTRY